MTRFLRSISLYLLVGSSLGLMLWAMGHRELLEPYVLRNRIAAGDRATLLNFIAVGGLFGGIVGTATRLATSLKTMENWGWRIAPLLVAAFLPFLLHYQLWVGRDITFCSLVVLCAGGARMLSEKAWKNGLYTLPQRYHSLIRLSPRVPLAVVLFASLSYALYFSISTINNHNNFGTSAFDMGIEDNLLWNTVHWGPLFRSAPLGGNMMHGGFHQTYFAYVIGLVYALVPRAETLLVIQSTFLGAAAIPLFLLARPRLGSGKAALLACLMLLYAPLHGANLYDFHYQPFGVFFILLIAYLFESGRSWRVLLPIVLLTLSVREDMGAMVGALGGYMLLSGKRPRDGLILALIGTTYFVTIKLIIMPQLFHQGQSSFAFIYKLLLTPEDQGFGGVLKTAIGNPAFTADTILTKEKLGYVLQIFAPLALLPLRRNIAWVLFLPGCVFTLLSTQYPALIMTSFQYTAYWTPMLFLFAVFSLERMKPVEDASDSRAHWGKQHAWLFGISLAILLSTVRYGAVFQVETARGAFDAVELRTSDAGRARLAEFESLTQDISPDAKVCASEWLISHVSNRRDAYTLRNGALDADYLLFWLHPTKFRRDERGILNEELFVKKRFGVIAHRGMFFLAKRGASTEKSLALQLRRDIRLAGTKNARNFYPEVKGANRSKR